MNKCKKTNKGGGGEMNDSSQRFRRLPGEIDEGVCDATGFNKFVTSMKFCISFFENSDPKFTCCFVCCCCCCCWFHYLSSKPAITQKTNKNNLRSLQVAKYGLS